MIDNKILDISGKTIFKIALTIICFYFIFQIKDILFWFIFALIISILFNPAIDFLQKKKIPRVFGVVLVYFSILGFFTFLIWLVVPVFAAEARDFLNSFPEYFEKINPILQGLGLKTFKNVQDLMNSLVSVLDSMSVNIFNALFAIFGGFFSTIFVITVAVFISLEEKLMDRFLSMIFPKKYEAAVFNIWTRSQKKVSGWFAARIIACLFVGISSWIIFLLFNVKYSFALALFAGAFNFIPYVGPLLTGSLLFLIIFPAEAFKAIFVIIAFSLVQQIENNILSPLLMKRLVDIPPVLVVLSLVIGAKLFGFLGALLIIPLAGIIFEFTKEFLQKRREKELTAS